MEYDHYAVLKIIGSQPEAFCIAFVSPGLPPGSFMKTSGDLTEKTLRSELEKMGRTKAESDSLIQKARDNPV
jgi:hypothetical protein